MPLCPHCKTDNAPGRDTCLACGRPLLGPVQVVSERGKPDQPTEYRPAERSVLEETDPMPPEGAAGAINSERRYTAASEPARMDSGPIPMPLSSTAAPDLKTASRVLQSNPPNERFAPGTVVAGRYRIVARLGKGGMGEVFRADDLTLHQQVAIKFLPENRSADRTAMQHLVNEVRIARKVTHPNVCRVYDIAEDSGRAFITMEYVDGEDLVTLLRRIGRLPEDKAIELTRQIAAGLAAAHDQGVLHRDLKPANIMIDGQGRAKITDFGLAGLAAELANDKRRAGTPAYMAPEQLFGAPATALGDIYSLGLLMYEMFTGQPVFRPKTMEELSQMHERPPISPSAHVPNLDPVVEALILRCMARDPRERPRNATMVAAGLPGGDPLSAALAAGITPSPEVVAAAGGEMRDSAGCVSCWLGVLLLLLGVTFGLAPRVTLVANSPLEKSPEVLADRAQQVLRDLGYDTSTPHKNWSLDYYEELVYAIHERSKAPDRWEMLKKPRPTAIDFWYRQSPVPKPTLGGKQRVSMQDPPMDEPGMVSVRLDVEGRLRELTTVVVQEPARPHLMLKDQADIDKRWDLLFQSAGLERSRFREIEPMRYPLGFADTRAAWDGIYPENPDQSIRVEAALLEGRPISFRIVERGLESASIFGMGADSPLRAVGGMVGSLFSGVSMLAAAALAWWNLRLRRGDKSGAWRLSLLTFAISMASFMLMADHVMSLRGQHKVLTDGLHASLLAAGGVWAAYVAIEPYVRRIWPETLIAWSRLMTGGARDPMVGKSVMVGVVVGCGAVVLRSLEQLSAPWIGFAPEAFLVNGELVDEALHGGRRTLGVLFETLATSVEMSLGILITMLLVKLLVRHMLFAMITWGVVQTVVWCVQSWSSPLSVLFYGGIAALAAFTLTRHGLLALICAALTFGILTTYPLTIDPTRWYFANSMFAVGVVVALAIGAAATAAGVTERRVVRI